MGKAYANKKTKDERPENDFYPTPKCLTWELLKTGVLKDCKDILEPCFGKGAISNILKENGFNVTCRDIMYGNDFLKDDYSNEHYDAVVTNPPFCKWDDFIKKSKDVADKVCVIGRTNYFGAHSRNIDGIWKNLEYVYVFDRQVDYTSEFREDGKVKCGCLITCWMVFNKEYNGDPKLRIIDVQKYILSKNEH